MTSTMTLTKQALAQKIDHTALSFQPSEDPLHRVQTLCEEAKRYGFFAVCVRPEHVALAKQTLASLEPPESSPSHVQVATVIGFPPDKLALTNERQRPTMGLFTTAHKLAETRETLSDGADELDLVMNVGLFLEEAVQGAFPQTLREFQAIKDLAGERWVKVIIETDLLTEEQIRQAVRVCQEAGVEMVKTSTGMIAGGHGGTPAVVSIIKTEIDRLGSPLGIKASGGIRELDQVLHLLNLGVNRLGMSAAVAVLKNI